MRNKKVVSLYIEENVLYATEFILKQKRYNVGKISSMKVQPDYIKDGCVVRQQEFAEELLNFFNNQGFCKSNVYLSLPEDRIILRLIKIPQMTEKEIKGYLLGEAEQYMMFKGEETVIDFFVIDEMQEGDQKYQLVLLAITSKKLIDSYFETFTYAGISLRQIIPVSLSIGLSYRKVTKENPVGIISVFKTFSNFYVFYQDRILFNRTIDIGDMSFKNVKYDELQKAMEEFLGEIQQTLRFYETQFPSARISSVVIWCKEKYPEFESLLQKTIKIPVAYSLPDMEEYDLEGIVAGEIEHIYPELSVIFGGARFYFEKEEIKFNVNLLPYYLRYGVLFTKKYLLAASLIPIVFIGSFLYSSLLGKDIKKYKDEIAKIDARIQEIDAKANTKEELESKIQQVKREISFLKETQSPVPVRISGTFYNIASFLRDIRYLIPQDVWINISSFDGVNFTISGYSLSQEGIAKFLTNLSTCGSFSSVGLEYSQEINYEGRNIFEFRIICGGKNI